MSPARDPEQRPTSARNDLFRPAALAEHAGSGSEVGALLRWTPGWLVWGYRLSLAVLVVAILFGVLGRVQERANGTAVVRRASATDAADPSAEGGEGVTLLAFLPGRHRPFLAVGDELLLRPDGFPATRLRATIFEVGDELVAPKDVRRTLAAVGAGPEADPESGPMVAVRAALDSAVFASGGAHHRLTDGMTGRADVLVREEPLALALFPALRRTGGGSDG